MGYTSLITFRVSPGRNADFEAAFERTGMLTRPRSMIGFLHAELHRSLDEPDTYIVIGQWATSDSYREWQARSLNETPGLSDLIDTLHDAQPGRLFHAIASSPE